MGHPGKGSVKMTFALCPAPEVVQPSSKGYSYSVDWWSLGVSAYEMLRGHRPFILEKNMSTSAIYQLLIHTRPSASVNWDNNTCDVLKMVSRSVCSVSPISTYPISLVVTAPG